MAAYGVMRAKTHEVAGDDLIQGQTENGEMEPPDRRWLAIPEVIPDEAHTIAQKDFHFSWHGHFHLLVTQFKGPAPRSLLQFRSENELPRDESIFILLLAKLRPSLLLSATMQVSVRMDRVFDAV